jgi:serine/threonine-protein kinase
LEDALILDPLDPGTDERYQSLFAIGRGGMGTVEVALDRCPDGSERVVAMKRLLPEMARDPRRNEMFLREARLAAMLSHPNVVHAFAFGERNGELFLAMEYVAGETLSHALATARERRQPVDPKLVAIVLAQVCDGLHAAHELRGPTGEPLRVVHRDVSPHNVMIAFEGRVKVLDFGVAKFEAASAQTRTGEVKGKMAYMSPEQALGEELDKRSDLFSVGAVLFECLAGQPMWGPGTDLEIMRRLALHDPPRLADAVPAAPPPLAALFSRLTARDRQGRPATAHDVALELRAFAGVRPSDEAALLGAWMDRLFRREAESRRILLAEAIAQAPSTGGAPNRRSIDPFAMPQRPSVLSRAESGDESRAWKWLAWLGPHRFWPSAVGMVGVVGAILLFRSLAHGPLPARAGWATGVGANATATPPPSTTPLPLAAPRASAPLTALDSPHDAPLAPKPAHEALPRAPGKPGSHPPSRDSRSAAGDGRGAPSTAPRPARSPVPLAHLAAKLPHVDSTPF